jgi:hypothetical protein
MKLHEDPNFWLCAGILGLTNGCLFIALFVEGTAVPPWDIFLRAVAALGSLEVVLSLPCFYFFYVLRKHE